MDIVAICNMALGRSGVSRFIMDINEKSNEAIVCSQFFDSVRDRCLTDFPWNFAQRTASLQDIGNPPFPWVYRYKYPNDCLHADRIDPSRKIPFTVVEDEANGGLALCANVQPLTLTYTARITTIPLWSAKFVNAVTWLLTSEIAPALSSKPEYAINAGKAYEAAIIAAGAENLNERVYSPPPMSEFLVERGYFDSYAPSVAVATSSTGGNLAKYIVAADGNTYQLVIVDNGDGTFSEQYVRVG